MALGLASWLVLTALGLVLIDLDAGPSLVSLPSGHGLTVVDAAGAAALVVGCVAPLLIGRGHFPRGRPRSRGRLLAGGAVLSLSAGLFAMSLFVPDFGGRKFVIGGFILVLQAAAALTVIARHNR